MSPVEAVLSALWPVKVYLTEKEITGKRHEKKKRGGEEQKKNTKTYALFPRPALLSTQALVTSRPALPIAALCGTEATRKKKNE